MAMVAGRVAITAIATATAFLVGTVLHEVTHWSVATGLDAEVVETSLLPPSPEVVFEASTPRVAAAIKACTVPVAAGILVAVNLAGSGRPFLVQLVLAAFALGYLPRSQSDWGGLVALVR